MCLKTVFLHEPPRVKKIAQTQKKSKRLVYMGWWWSTFKQ